MEEDEAVVEFYIPVIMKVLVIKCQESGRYFVKVETDSQDSMQVNARWSQIHEKDATAKKLKDGLWTD